MLVLDVGRRCAAVLGAPDGHRIRGVVVGVPGRDHIDGHRWVLDGLGCRQAGEDERDERCGRQNENRWGD